jgi:hypothetical protein
MILTAKVMVLRKAESRDGFSKAGTAFQKPTTAFRKAV